MNNEVLIMEKQEVPAIRFNKEDLIQRVDSILKQHEGVIYTEDNIPEARKILADLRKQKKYLNSERINACKPYESVVKRAKSDMDDVLSKYDHTIQEIDTQIKDYEAAWKQDREDYIKETYKTFFIDQIPEQYHSYPTISKVTIDPKWMLKGTSKKKIKDQIIDNKDTLLRELDTISQIAEAEFSADVEAEYLRTLDLNLAIRKNEELREAKRKVLEAERKKKEEELRKREEKQKIEEQQKNKSVDPFNLNFDSFSTIPIPEPINQSQRNINSKLSEESNHHPEPISHIQKTTKVKTLHIKIRGEESVLHDIMNYIYSKDIEILPLEAKK